jgi:DNA-binding XRE family transcriptional regulator
MGVANPLSSTNTHSLLRPDRKKLCSTPRFCEKDRCGAAVGNSNLQAADEPIIKELIVMDDFQKQLERLKKNPVFARVYSRRRAETEVAFQIRRLREAKGWSQKELAKRVGCSQQAVSAVEQAGYKRHSLPLLRRIAAVLDADVVVALIPRKAA